MIKSAARQINYQAQFEQGTEIENRPDLNKMFSYKVGSCTYYFKTIDKYNTFKDKHEKELAEEAKKQAAKDKYWKLVEKVEGKVCGECKHPKRNEKYQYNCSVTKHGAGFKKIKLSDKACLKFKAIRK